MHFNKSFTNMMVSYFIFGAVNIRLISLRFKNKIKGFLVSKNLRVINDVSMTKIFIQFKTEGYNKLNIGGGTKNLKGFINIDFASHPTVEREIKANVLDLSFVPDASVCHIHNNHLVEHLTHEQFCQQLYEYYRILEKDGVLTMRCPNALGVCYGFWFKVMPETGRNEFITLGYPDDDDFYNPLDSWYHKNFFGFLHWIYGDRGNIENQHLDLLTPTKMTSTVEAAGFNVLKMTEPEATNIIVVARKEL